MRSCWQSMRSKVSSQLKRTGPVVEVSAGTRLCSKAGTSASDGRWCRQRAMQGPAESDDEEHFAKQERRRWDQDRGRLAPIILGEPPRHAQSSRRCPLHWLSFPCLRICSNRRFIRICRRLHAPHRWKMQLRSPSMELPVDSICSLES